METLVGIVALEMSGINLYTLDHCHMPKFNNAPVISRFSATSCFPPVTHVDLCQA
jgi:hypothetical protein